MTTSVAIIGAGPYGLSIAAHLRSRNVPYRIFGMPLDTWRQHMPRGMLLKSDGFASSLSDAEGRGTLSAYCAAHGIAYHPTDVAIGLDLFNAYALDFQRRFVPDLEERTVVALDRAESGFTLRLDDGEIVRAQTVVAAVGISHFGDLPPVLAHLPPELASHSSAHHDLADFAGRSITVIGGGSSAVDIAALLHEAGARTQLIARRPALRFFSAPGPAPSRWRRIRHPSSGLGPGLRSWLCENWPGLFRFLPGDARLTIIRRHLGPKSAWAMKARLEAGVTIALGETVEEAVAANGMVQLTLRDAEGRQRTLLMDHVIAATGYAVNVDRLGFLSARLRASIRTHANMPLLSGRFESSVPGLYFTGPPAVNSFGPLMRFMVGAEYAAPVIARHLARKMRRVGVAIEVAPA